MPPGSPGQPLNIRIGHGWDLHRLTPLASVAPGVHARPFMLGGVKISDQFGVIAHSDGDTLLHAITDAILGALAQPDIGQMYPDSDPRNSARNSADFLQAALNQAASMGWFLGNLDATVILQAPKIAPHKDAIRRNLALLLGISQADINIKGKTHEGVDAVGESRAVEVHAVVLMQR